MGNLPFKATIALPLAAVIVIAAAYLGLTQWLGAHPFWATKIAWIGAAIGLVAAIALRTLHLGFPKEFIILAILVIASVATANYGKTAFANSFAEDQLAGRLWYFGWIAAAASVTALLACSFWRAKPRSDI